MNITPPIPMKNDQLANAELAIMELLWENEQMTAREILETLYSKSRSSQHGTVQRLLQRLEEKGFVERDRTQFVHRFSATMSREEHAAGQLESLASRLTSGSIAPLITHLVETNKITDDEIARIRAILDASGKGGDGE